MNIHFYSVQIKTPQLYKIKQVWMWMVKRHRLQASRTTIGKIIIWLYCVFGGHLRSEFVLNHKPLCVVFFLLLSSHVRRISYTRHHTIEKKTKDFRLQHISHAQMIIIFFSSTETQLIGQFVQLNHKLEKSHEIRLTWHATAQHTHMVSMSSARRITKKSAIFSK